MSFSAIRSIATSALTATQVQMQVTSNNIANADVNGYTRKVATQTTLVSSGSGVGTSVTAVASVVDKYLLADTVSAASALGAATVAADKADAAQSLLGATSGSDDQGTSIAAAITTLQSSLTSLGGTIESTTLQNLTLDSFSSLTANLRETAAGIEDLRADADQQIADGIAIANDALAEIGALNDMIVQAKALGQPTGDLEDKRNLALATLAEQLDVSYIVKADGQMRVSTTSGTPLVDGSVHELSYSPASVVTSDTVFAAISVDGKDVTGEIRSGAIGGLLEQRDSVLPAMVDTLDTLTKAAIDLVNAAYNAGTSLPAPSTLTGSTELGGSDAFAATGTLRIAIVEDDGSLVASEDIDLSQFTTVDDLVDALDALSGISASIASGQLVISSDAGQGVALAGDIEIGAAASGFSDYFGLNDLLTGDSAATIRVRSDLLDGTTELAINALSLDTLSSGDVAVSPSSTVVQTLADALSRSTDFPASGKLASSTSTLAGYATAIVGSIATTAETTASALETRQLTYDSASDALTSLTGVNIDEETARLSTLEQEYQTAAQLLEALNAMFDALLSAANSA